MPLRGIRGATTSQTNNQEQILDETQHLLEKMLEENAIQRDEIASIFFSTTRDLDAVFPAKAARRMGLIDTPLLCLNEIPVPGSIAKCIRLLIHVNTDLKQSEINHIYLKEAVSLRPDQSPGA